MRGWIFSATLGAVLVAVPLWAQRGGGHGGMGGGHGFSGGGHGSSGGGAAHAGAVSGYHPSVGYARAPVYGGGPHGWNGGNWRGNGWNGNNWHGNGLGFRYRPWGWGYPGWGWGSAGWGYPWWGWSGGLGWDSYDSYGPYVADSYAAGNYDVQGYPSYVYVEPSGSASYASREEVQQIQAQVNQLRAQQAQKGQPHGDTVLVYRDGHTENVLNYAIAGNTLWIFDETRARKVPLSSLDLPATQRDNEDRGGEFVVPNAR